VLAFGREAYGKFDLNLKDLLESIFYPGFQKMAMKHWRMGWGEMWRSYNKGAFVKALQRLIPEIEAKHLHSVPAGIRAQAVSPDGAMVGRLPYSGKQPDHQCLQRPFPSSNCVAQYWSNHCQEFIESLLKKPGQN
jgi:L-2-hydroxyglutarate oxidase